MKNFYASKTFWFNILFLLVTVASMFGFADFQPSEAWGEIALAVVTVVNVVLRIWFTDQPIRH